MRCRIPLVLLVLLPVLVQAQSGADWKKITPDYPFQFPRDHGAHLEYRTEWWYFTGNVRSESGREFGYQHTIFRQGIDPEPLTAGQSVMRPRHVFFAHFAIADIQNQRFSHAERIRRMGAGLVEASQETCTSGWRNGKSGRRRMGAFISMPSTGSRGWRLSSF